LQQKGGEVNASFYDPLVKQQQKVVAALQLEEERQDTLLMKKQQALDFEKSSSATKAQLSAQDIARFEAQKLAAQGLYDQTRAQEIANIDAKIANTETEAEIRRLSDEKQLLLFEQNQAAQLALEKKFKDQNLLATEEYQLAQKALIEKGALDIAQVQINADKKVTANQKAQSDLRTANQRDTFSAIATLSQSNNQTLAQIGKAAGITQIAIDTPVAISKALAAFPPPFNFVAAGLVGVAMAAQAARIAGVPLATGITEVPPGFNNDTFPARLTSGERVLSVEQNKDLGKFLDSQDPVEQQKSNGLDEETKGIFQLIANRLGALENTIVVNIGNKEIMREVREGIRSGQQVAV
jgi:hypothetical protein